MKVYLPNPKFIFSVLIHAVIYYWDVKLWGRVSINADNNYCWNFPTTLKSRGFIALSTDVEGNIDLVKPIGLSSLYLNRLQFAPVAYLQVYAFVIGV